jgi:hypothetical protein
VESPALSITYLFNWDVSADGVTCSAGLADVHGDEAIAVGSVFFIADEGVDGDHLEAAPHIGMIAAEAVQPVLYGEKRTFRFHINHLSRNLGPEDHQWPWNGPKPAKWL